MATTTIPCCGDDGGGGGAPSGPAGGVLGGTYPDPSFAEPVVFPNGFQVGVGADAVVFASPAPNQLLIVGPGFSAAQVAIFGAAQVIGSAGVLGPLQVSGDVDVLKGSMTGYVKLHSGPLEVTANGITASQDIVTSNAFVLRDESLVDYNVAVLDDPTTPGRVNLGDAALQAGILGYQNISNGEFFAPAYWLMSDGSGNFIAMALDDLVAPSEIVVGDTALNLSTTLPTNTANVGAPVTTNSATFSTLLELDTTPASLFGLATGLEIVAVVTPDVGSDGNVEIRVLVDDDDTNQNRGGGAQIFTGVSSTPDGPAVVLLLLSIDPTSSHNVKLQWRAPAATTIGVDPNSDNTAATLAVSAVIL